MMPGDLHTFFAFQKKKRKCFRVPVTVQDFSTGWNMRKMQLHVHHGRKKRFRPATLAAASTGWQPSDERNKVPIWVQQKMIFVSPNLDKITWKFKTSCFFVGKRHVIFWRNKINSFLIEKYLLVKHRVIFGAHVIIESLKQLLPKSQRRKKRGAWATATPSLAPRRCAVRYHGTWQRFQATNSG